MVKSQTLNERPFDITDGDRFIIIAVKDKNTHLVFTRKYLDKPVMSPDFKTAKTFKDYKTAQKSVDGLFGDTGYQNAIITRVDQIFEPRYFISYREKHLAIPTPMLRCYTDWFIIGENPVNTYTDYQEANEVLEKYKRNLLEFYYKEILALREFKLTKIQKGDS